jgi:hypothetical protein
LVKAGSSRSEGGGNSGRSGGAAASAPSPPWPARERRPRRPPPQPAALRRRRQRRGRSRHSLLDQFRFHLPSDFGHARGAALQHEREQPHRPTAQRRIRLQPGCRHAPLTGAQTDHPRLRTLTGCCDQQVGQGGEHRPARPQQFGRIKARHGQADIELGRCRQQPLQVDQDRLQQQLGGLALEDLATLREFDGRVFVCRPRADLQRQRAEAVQVLVHS